MEPKIQISKPVIGKAEINAVVKILESGNLSQGPVVKELERQFAEYCGAKYAIALSNGTATLHTALYALGIEEGDEVITTPFTFVATANSIMMQRAKPVFVDIEPDTFNIDPALIEKKITKKTKAIMPVDLFGHPYDVKAVNKIAKDHGLFTVEDAAQSIGAEYKGKRTGTLADIASFSLYATKNLTAGVGGMLVTNNKKVMEKCKLFRHHGQKEDTMYEYIEFGYNYRMMDMIAAIAIEQMKKAEKLTKQRQDNAARYDKALAGIPGLILPNVKPGYKHVYHQYTLRITEEFPMSRDKFVAYMEKHNVQCKIYYPKPLHMFPHIQEYGYKPGDFPVSEQMSREVVSIPVHPLVTKEGIRRIIKLIKAIK